ncbi:MAG TPA: RICIN domain-containing protein [Actinospica sp.]|nr:RICIN domain-containing protein [Actinospica sp.]
MGVFGGFDGVPGRAVPAGTRGGGGSNGGSNQQWTLESNGSIVGLYSDLCVTTTGQGGSVELDPCNGSTTQKWSWG